ncbi:hypothetical protein PG994_006062 [Apiospora phragmitis]|uniref:RRM domain-containing protein n=1 Tax=Apiospora phragmitis TaxID=2905665 RepID=A0ABR1VE02_9PEZI
MARLVGGWGHGSCSVKSASETTRVYQGVRANRRQYGFLEFTDEDKMRRFAQDASKWTFDGEKLAIEILFDRATDHEYQYEQRQSDSRKRKEREKKKQTPPPEMLDMQGEDLGGSLGGLLDSWM